MPIKDASAIIVISILILFGLLETLAGHLRKQNRSAGDWIEEAGGFAILSVLIKPGIVLVMYALGNQFFPQASTLFQGMNFWLAVAVYLLLDDFMQYWYHRLAHEQPFLWKLHRAHHQAEQMGFFVSYRNAALYYVLMPNIWWIGFCTFAGGAGAVAVGLILKQVIIISSHSTLPWDRPLYKSRLLRPIVLFLERIIITPAFHHGHHGRSKLDGVSDPNGNFGNMFSIWDQLFGSANFSHEFPGEYGLQTPTNDHWTASYLYPAVASSDESSELARSFSKSSTVVAHPERVEMEVGEKILWCACGMSRKQPYCDGSHHGTKVKPMVFEAPKSGRIKLCNCKLTKSPPYCDGAHKTMDSYVHPVD